MLVYNHRVDFIFYNQKETPTASDSIFGIQTIRVLLIFQPLYLDNIRSTSLLLTKDKINSLSPKVDCNS